MLHSRGRGLTKFLYPVIAGVHHVDVAGPVDAPVCHIAVLTITGPVGTNRPNEYTRRGELLDLRCTVEDVDVVVLVDSDHRRGVDLEPVPDFV